MASEKRDGSAPRTKRFSRRKAGGRAILQALALLLTALYAVPMAYVVLVSLTPNGEPLGVWPSSLEFGNFVDAFLSANFVQFFFNSAVVAVVCSGVQVILACAAGYSLAMLPVRGRNLMLLLLIALLVVPPEVAIVPLFVIVAHFPLAGGNDVLGNGGQGLLDSLPGIMVPHIVSALAIFLMRQFYASLPGELGDAARVDGAGEVRIFAMIYTPLVKPAVAILGISIPIVVLFLLIQRFFRDGALAGALK
jgi:multiple sugar transport system permease protein